jgi:uncharacterized protein
MDDQIKGAFRSPFGDSPSASSIPGVSNNPLFNNDVAQDQQKLDKDVTAFFSAQNAAARTAAASALRDEVAKMASQHDPGYVAQVFKQEAAINHKFAPQMRTHNPLHDSFEHDYLEFKDGHTDLKIAIDQSAFSKEKVTTTARVASSDRNAAPPEYFNEASEEVARKLFMWKVTGAHGTSYLLGSMHKAPSGFYPLPQKMEQAFNSSGQLVGELDLNKDRPQYEAMLQKEGFYQNGDSLDKHLSSGTLQSLHKILLEKHIDPSSMMKMKPWMAGIALASVMAPLDRGQPGIDEHFFSEAKAKGKPTAGLENVMDQIKLFEASDKGPDAVSADELIKEIITSGPKADEMVGKLVSSWKNGSVELMRKLGAEEENQSKDPASYDQLEHQRNIKMEAKIEDLLKSNQTSFIVVGAMHMGGADGLVQLLRKKGYSVEQVDQ